MIHTYSDKKQLFYIRSIVLLLHLAFFSFVVLVSRTELQRHSATKIMVRTVQLDAPKKAAKQVTKAVAPPVEEAPAPVPLPPAAVEEPKEAVKPKPQPKPTPKPVQKKEVAKPVKKPQAVPKQPPPKVNKEQEAKKRAHAEADKKAKAQAEKRQAEKRQAEKKQKEKQETKQNALIADALSSLNRSGELDQKKEKLASAAGSTVKGPSQIKNLASDSLVTVENEGEKLTGHEKTYYDELVHRLKLELKLPDFGDVKINLTLNRAGKVVKVQCVKSKNSKNRAHIEKMLPKILFPAFGSNFGSENEHTFRLLLTNELNY